MNHTVSTYRFGRFELDPATRRLLADGKEATLGARSFDVLVALVERHDRMVTKDELLQLVWPGLVVEENNLQVQISALRKILGQQAIATVPGRGYRFAARLDSDVVPVPEATIGTVAAQPASATPIESSAATEMPLHAGAPLSRRWQLLGVAGALLLLGAGWWLFMRQQVSVTPKATTTVAAQADRKSVAVLPFANLSDDRNNAYFADGIHEDLLTQLSLLRDLKVVSRTSVMEYRNSPKKVGQIGAELAVGTLIEGSVRRAGNRVRVSAQLIDVRSDKHLWARSFDRELNDIFAIQTELATEIAKALEVSLDPRERAQLARSSTDNVAAYELLQRWSEWHRVNVGVAPEEAIALLSRAVELDPRSAIAWARLGTEHALMHFWELDRSDARLAKAQQSIERAIALAPEDLAVQGEVGNFYYYGLGDYARASSHFENLLRGAPNNVDILLKLSLVKRRLGRWLEAKALLERARTVDPRNLDVLRVLRIIPRQFRRWDEEIELMRKVVDLLPGHLHMLGWLHSAEIRKSRSYDNYDRWRASLSEDAAKRWPFIWYLDLRRAAARRDFDFVLRALEAPPENEAWHMLVLPKEWRALVLLAKGERERALEIARASLAEVTERLEREPDHQPSLFRSSLDHAILGEREAAFADYERWHALIAAHPDFERLMYFLYHRSALYAALGDRDRALQSLAENLRTLGGIYPWGTHWQDDLMLLPLWDDPRFQRLASDPANNAPMPIVNWDLSKMLRQQ